MVLFVLHHTASSRKKILLSPCPYFNSFAVATTAIEPLADTSLTYHVFGGPGRAAVAAIRSLRTESYSKCLHTSSRATHLLIILFPPATSYVQSCTSFISFDTTTTTINSVPCRYFCTIQEEDRMVASSSRLCQSIFCTRERHPRGRSGRHRSQAATNNYQCCFERPVGEHELDPASVTTTYDTSR